MYAICVLTNCQLHMEIYPREIFVFFPLFVAVVGAVDNQQIINAWFNMNISAVFSLPFRIHIHIRFQFNFIWCVQSELTVMKWIVRVFSSSFLSPQNFNFYSNLFIFLLLFNFYSIILKWPWTLYTGPSW